MLNEGLVFSDTKTVMKSEMVKQLQRLGRTTPEQWERAVFEALTGGRREQVDWDVPDNQAGYYTWIKKFDQLVQELIEDGYVREDVVDGAERRVLIPVEPEPPGDWSQLVYPPRS